MDSEAKFTAITLPYPPTVNTYWRHIGKGRVVISARGRKYREQVIDDVISEGSPMLTGRLKIVIRAYMPDRRRRDIDNLTKALLDALAHARLYDDDEQIDDLRIIRMGVEKPGRVEVELTELVKV